jgi:hypothetical protein
MISSVVARISSLLTSSAKSTPYATFCRSHDGSWNFTITKGVVVASLPVSSSNVFI